MSQCFAFNREGLRCSLPGGHDDMHEVKITFDDDDILIPTREPDIRTEASVYPTPPTQAPSFTDPPRPGICILCDHKMHNIRCTTGECDCSAGIEG